MGQVIPAGIGDNALHDTATEYARIDGVAIWEATEDINELLYFAVAGTLINLRVLLHNSTGTLTAPPSGKTFAFTVMKNASASSLTTTISGAETSDQDLTNSVDIAAGDRVSLRCVPTGGAGANRYASWSLVFIPDTAGESVYFNAGGPWNKASGTGFATLVGVCSSPDAHTQANMRQYAATAGKIKNLRLALNQAPGTGAEAYRLTLYINQVATAMTVTISGASTSGNYTATEITVTAGDLCAWFIEPLNSPTNGVNASFGFAFVPDDNQESLIAGGSDAPLNTGATAYFALHSDATGWDTDEFDARQFVQDMVVRNLYVQVSVAPGVGKSWVFTVMKNGSPTSVTVTIAGTDKTGTDLTNEVAFSNDDYMSLRAEPSGTPAAANARWGAVQDEFVSTSPTVTTQANTGTIAEKSTGHGNILSDGGADITQHGHVWSENFNPDVDDAADSKTENGAAPNLGQFQSDMTGLNPGTTYYVRAYATNANGTSYGANVIITASTTIGRRYWWVEKDEFHFFGEDGTEFKIKGTAVANDQDILAWF